MEVVKGNLDGGTEIKLNLPKLNKLGQSERMYYIIDFSKVTKIEELVTIIASMGVMISDDNPFYEKLSHLFTDGVQIKESELNKRL